MTTEARPCRIAMAYGDLIGTEVDGIRVFHGVPFAEPPVGELRWRAPRRPRPWSGLRDATVPAPAPIQPASPYLPRLRTDEDCLHLSVWTPDEPGPWPVVCWLYGGGFEGGTAVSPVTDPPQLVREQRVVVVAPHYRVGALGFAELRQHGGPYAEASNLGLRDVVAALSWVSANISAFGGQPGAVTVVGQSAGAFLAGALPATPSAAGLFHRLALFSGGASRLVPLDRARQIGDDFLAALGGSSTDAVLAAQQTAVARDIGARNGPRPHSFGVVLDGELVNIHPMRAATETASVPMLVATTTEEVAAMRGPEQFAAAGLPGVVDEVVSWGVERDRAEAVVRHYATGRSPDQSREALLTDYIYRLPALRLAAGRAASGAHTWVCAFGRSPSLGPVAGHGMETPLLFGTTEAPPVADLFGYPSSAAGRRRELSRRIREHLGAFVHRGDPGWPAVTTPRRIGGLLVADDDLSHQSDLDGGTREIWEGIERP
ncbi:carboxylesterase family protein [Micromonospora endophytica]|uniref:Carboxylic ester hydrolase n=1 Tax=Micromonospora endophytica TaxID=515350 RepID=A0A2W2DH96_9ACTN|nr:carboxylesterase family protein [Micromonospora endophytica]PZG00130.1 carboxylesterase [Micromonospora endophytica]RIW42263.1 carboxylesterase/lipase family protein [Micromonospora endophytica]BCJ61460.1 carboxylic ester hydrolase [Micromonospora endophytica]